MPVEFLTDPSDPEGIYWKQTPLILDQEYINQVYDMSKEYKDIAMQSNGWVKGKGLKWHGSVPEKIWFDRITQTGRKDYWSADNWKNYRKFINENPVFRCGDHIV